MGLHTLGITSINKYAMLITQNGDEIPNAEAKCYSQTPPQNLIS